MNWTAIIFWLMFMPLYLTVIGWGIYVLFF
jgi:hypothetical protein